MDKLLAVFLFMNLEKCCGEAYTRYSVSLVNQTFFIQTILYFSLHLLQELELIERACVGTQTNEKEKIKKRIIRE